MRVLITGASGFVGKNLASRLAGLDDVQVDTYTRSNSREDLNSLVLGADFIFHLAGVNRPPSPDLFMSGNFGLTQDLCTALAAGDGLKACTVVYTSSTQAALENAYGQSKRAAEQALCDMAKTTGNQVVIYRLPNVFGPESKPNYNSAVATFCHNIARNLPIQIHDPTSPLKLVYIDDVVDSFVRILRGEPQVLDEQGFVTGIPHHASTVGQVAGWISDFHQGRLVQPMDPSQAALIHALHKTYLSMVPSSSHSE